MTVESDTITRREALKRIGAAGLAVSAATAAGAPSAVAQMRRLKRSLGGTVNYFTYSVYSVPQYFVPFTKATGITVTASNYGTEEELLSKMRATRGAGYDIMNVNNAIVGEMAKEGLIQPIDRS